MSPTLIELVEKSRQALRAVIKDLAFAADASEPMDDARGQLLRARAAAWRALEVLEQACP